MVIRNMTYQHREFQSRLRDAERLRLYAQSVVSDHKVLRASLAEAGSRSRRWEKEAKEGVEKVARAEAERDVARHQASHGPHGCRCGGECQGDSGVQVG